MKSIFLIILFSWVISLTIAVCVVDSHANILAKRLIAQEFVSDILTESLAKTGER